MMIISPNNYKGENMNCSTKKLFKNKPRIICISGKSNVGKSETIRELAQILLPFSTRSPVWHKPKSAPSPKNLPIDITLEVWVKNEHIGIHSMGDEEQGIKKALNLFAKNGCSLIFCTCRSKGNTLNAVTDFAKRNSYTLITTATYFIKTTHIPAQENGMNIRKAVHLEALI
jgi:hypothetical protein